MDEKSVLNLISQSVRHILREYGAGWDERAEQEVSDRVADVAWNCLILGMREMFSEGRPAAFDELGRFQLADGKWEFEPADSILEAGALSMNHEEGNQLMAVHALYYISQATSLIKRIPDEVILPRVRGELNPEESLKRAIFSDTDELKYKVVCLQKLNAMFDAVAHLQASLSSVGKDDRRSQDQKIADDFAMSFGRLMNDELKKGGAGGIPGPVTVIPKISK